MTPKAELQSCSVVARSTVFTLTRPHVACRQHPCCLVLYHHPRQRTSLLLYFSQTSHETHSCSVSFTYEPTAGNLRAPDYARLHRWFQRREKKCSPGESTVRPIVAVKWINCMQKALGSNHHALLSKLANGFPEALEKDKVIVDRLHTVLHYWTFVGFPYFPSQLKPLCKICESR